MTPLIEKHRTELIDICRRNHVAKLEVFGSAAIDEFDSKRSDLDFLVEFGDISPEKRFSTFFELQRSLSALFGRPVDLVEPGAMRNPYFIRRVNESRRLVYAA